MKKVYSISYSSNLQKIAIANQNNVITLYDGNF